MGLEQRFELSLAPCVGSDSDTKLSTPDHIHQLARILIKSLYESVPLVDLLAQELLDHLSGLD